jgi:hypothetical protein
MPSLAEHVRTFLKDRKTYDEWRLWWAGVFERWTKFSFDIATRVLVISAFQTVYKLTGSIVAFWACRVLVGIFSLWMTFIVVRALGIREWEWGGQRRWLSIIDRVMALLFFLSIMMLLQVWLSEVTTMIASTK